MERFGNSMPPSATGSLLSPLSAPLCTASGSCSPVRFSPLNRAGVETPGLLQLAYAVRAVRELQRPSKNTAAVLAQSLAASPRPHHCGILLKGRRLPGSLLDLSGWCHPSTCGGGGRSPYASPQPTRSAVAATPLNRASLRPSVRQKFIHLLAHLLMSTPSV